MTAPLASSEPAELVWGSYNALAYVPKLPHPAYQVLLFLLSRQEPGGRCVFTHKELSDELPMDRTLVTRAMQHLGFARLVLTEKRGYYHLNPMVAGFRTPAEQMKAIQAMPAALRLDRGNVEEKYQEAIKDHEERKALRQRANFRVVPD